MAVSYSDNGDAFVADKPRVWLARFEGLDFDLSPDGKRIIAIAPVPSAARLQHRRLSMRSCSCKTSLTNCAGAFQ